MQSRTRAVMLGLLAVMLAGSVMAATASAGPGPFWYHRPVGAKEPQLKVSANAPENFRGTGGEQTLVGTFGTESVEVRSKSVQVKGAISNGPFQGQIKLEIIYLQPEVVKPAAKPCNVVVGASNIVAVKGHLMWKYNGVVKQLEEQKQEEQTPEIVFTPTELQQGATGLPKGEFTSLTFKGAGCGVLTGGARQISGSEVGFPSPSHVEEWSQKLSVRTVPGKELLQHFWNGAKNVEAKVGLEFTSNPASLIGQTEVTAEQQEIAVKEN